MQSDPNPDVIKKDVAIERMGILANFNLDSQGVYVSAPLGVFVGASVLLLPAWCGMFLCQNRFSATAAATLCIPARLLAGLLGPLLSTAAGLAMCVLFVAYARRMELAK